MDDPNFEMRRHTPASAQPPLQVDVPGQQRSLFAEDELIVPDSLKSMRKAVSAIHLVPVKPDHRQGLNSLRLMDACILIAQLECRGKETELLHRLKSDRISPLFETRISKLAELAGIPGKNYERIYEELDRLFEHVFRWNVLAEDATVEWEMKAHFFSILGHGKHYKRGYVRFGFDASVLEIILEPTVWAKLSLEATRSLKTGSAYRLYQCTWKYIGVQSKLTAALPVHVWIELLVGPSGYVTERPDGRPVANYGEFKRRILTDAISKVNDCAALAYTLKLKEHKSGNRVVKLQFEFVPKTQRSLSIPLTWSSDVVGVLAKVGLSSQEIDDLSQAYPLDQVVEALKRLEAAEMRQKEKGNKIFAKRAYFEGILRNLVSGAQEKDLADEKILAEIRAQEAKKAAEDRMTQLKSLYQDHLKKRFCDWLFGLSDSTRKGLLTEFLESQQENPAIRQVMKKDMQRTDFSSQALLRNWITQSRPLLYEEAFPNPEDRSFENWMAWRLMGGDALDAG